MSKYDKIDRSKLNEKGKSVYDRLKKDTNDFKSVAGKRKEVLDKILAKQESLKSKSAPKKSKKKSSKKKKSKAPINKGTNRGSFAKLRAAIAKRDGISYKAALPIAKKEYAAQKNEKTEKKRSKYKGRLDAFKRKYKGKGTRFVMEKGELRPLDVDKDAKIPAKAVGKRISEGKGKNQYGKSTKGNVYYEYRDNRTDQRQPQPTNIPRLNEGGDIVKDFDVNEPLGTYARGGKFPSLRLSDFDEDIIENTYNELVNNIDKTIARNMSKHSYYKNLTPEEFDRQIKRLRADFGELIREITYYAKGGMIRIESGNKGKTKVVYNKKKEYFTELESNEVFDEEKLKGKSVFLFVDDELYDSHIADGDDYDMYAKGGKVEKYIIVRGTKESEKYYYQKGTNEYDYKWLRSKKDATIFDNIKQAEKAADESDGDIEILGTYAKGGKTDDDFIQEAVKEMEKEGTVGAFSAKAKKAGMTTVNYAKKVLTKPEDFSEKTRKQAQFMKNINPELFSFGGEITRNFDVKSPLGTYAAGGEITDAGDVDYPNEILNYEKGGNVRNKDEAYVRMNKGYVATIRKYEDLVNHPNLNDDLKNIEIVNINDESSDKFKNQVTDFVSDIIVKNPPQYVDMFLNQGMREVYIYCSHPDGVFGNYYMPQGRDFDIFIPYISKGSRELNIEKYKPKSAFTKSMKKYIEENCSTMAKGGELLDADTDVEYAKGGKVEGYIKSYNKRMDRAFEEMEKEGLEDYDSFQFVEETGGFKPEEVAGYYYDTYGNKAYDTWKSNTKGKRLSEDDKKVDRILKSEKFAKGGRQGYDDKLDESLGNRRGKRSKKRQNYKDRRDESKGMERARYRRAYSSVGTMDKRERYL